MTVIYRLYHIYISDCDKLYHKPLICVVRGNHLDLSNMSRRPTPRSQHLPRATFHPTLFFYIFAPTKWNPSHTLVINWLAMAVLGGNLSPPSL